MNTTIEVRTELPQTSGDLTAQEQAEVDEISNYIQSFIRERFPKNITPELQVILADVMLESVEWGAKYNERKSIEERRIITNV